MVLSSRKNPAVLKYRRLARERAYREECGEFPIEGARLCDEAVRCGLALTGFYATEAAREKYEKIFSAISQRIAPIMISADVADYISDTKSPQGLFITAKTLDKTPDMGKIIKGGRYLLLDGLQDPGNVGTMLRTADAFGLSGVILSPDCADLYAPKTVRSAMGSLFRLAAIRMPLVGAVAELKKSGYRVYAATPDVDAVPITRLTLGENTAVVIGNEGNGISREVYLASDQKLYIPIENAESLNAASAAAIVCWELRRNA
ncbi:MAG: RNA methyltransferase [Bacteroides sp.]|nr:RNA methyltransferase [Eubacterium sp.]MCM1418580.1 RNA methyltransferase [Roseburia sp.]MCM1462635.1 RNA methyltransferase [Bacteroides sp.]